jgi:TRAP-type C4-dicarboxylate transport system permease small subunit
LSARASLDALDKILHALASGLAVSGGLVLLALVVMTVVSIIGRALWSAPIPGDFELVEIGCALAVFASLPYCQLVGGHVIIGFFTAGAGRRTRAWLDAGGNFVFAAIAALLSWRLGIGALELERDGETTMVLRLPIWWGFIPATLCMGLLALVCAYTGWLRLGQARRG